MNLYTSQIYKKEKYVLNCTDPSEHLLCELLSITFPQNTHKQHSHFIELSLFSTTPSKKSFVYIPTNDAKRVRDKTYRLKFG